MIMKRRLISIALSMIMTFSVINPVFSEEEIVSSDPVFSENPKDMTPAEQDYSPGLGDRMDAISYTIGLGWLGSSTGLSVATTYDQALAIQNGVANLTNGAHQVPYAIGQDVLRWGSSPYLIEDTAYPMGDGTPGSGYAKYREYVENSFAYNSDVSQILEPLLAGTMRDDYASEEEKIPLSCYTHDENGQKKIGWSAGGYNWYLLSLYNLYETGYAQSAWQRMKDTWNLRSHVYYDAMIPVAEGLYNNPNLTTKYGGVITNTEMEWDAVQREIKYSWENYAISSGQEYLHSKYKGLSNYFTVPYGIITDNDYLNTWGNSVMISNRGDEYMNLVWGSEVGTTHADAFQFNGSHQPWDAFVTRLMEHNFQYLYMMERRPLSYTNDTGIYRVTFSGDLVSTYNKKTNNYTLIENGDFVIADGGDRFIPQVGAGCKIYAYSRDGKTRTWKLPDTWDGVTKVDVYLLSESSAPVKKTTLDVADGSVTVTMNAGAPYLLVPKGDAPTPQTANFNEVADGETVGTYQSLDLSVSGNPEFKVYEASARGGFTTPSIYADTADTSAVAQIGMADGAILHSLKIGNKGGEGRVVLHSSNPLNPDVVIDLPETDQVYKFNTSWVYGETGNVSVKIENDSGVSNTLFDAIMYSETSRVKSCTEGDHEYSHVHVSPTCGADGRDSDVCDFCGHEENVTVTPAIGGEHNFTDKEEILTATPHNTGTNARFCLRCSCVIEEEIPALFDAGNHVFHHDYGNNYMQTKSLRPYTDSKGTVSFDIMPLDVTARSNGPCYLGVWFGKGYSVCAAYDFSAKKFVIGKNNTEFTSSISNPLASKSYTWEQALDGNYKAHKFTLELDGNTATIYLDGVQILSCTDQSFASADDILLMYTKGEFLIDNIIAAGSDYDVTTGNGSVIMQIDFENGSEALSEWILGGYITTDIRAFDMSGYFSDDHVHTNVLVASHEATYFHGSYDEYECVSCYKRTAVNVDEDVLDSDALVHMSKKDPGCTYDGHLEYWYDHDGNRFSDAGGSTGVTLEEVTTAAVGHDLSHHPAVEANGATEGFVEYWSCLRCKRSFADEKGNTEMSLVKTDAVRETENAIAAIGKVSYKEESKVQGSGIVGTFTTGEGNSNYSVLDVGNKGQKLNADYTVEMLIRIRDVDKTTEIGGAKGAFFGLSCENFTVGYDFVTERWGVSPIAGLFASYPFNPSETGPVWPIDDGYFHTVRFECTTEAVRVFVDGSCVLNESSLVRENNRYCIFYPRLCTVEFASYAFMYNGAWINDHLTGSDIVTASTWRDRGTAYGTTAQSLSGTMLIDSLRSIENAERMYDELSENEKLLVSNYETLVDSRRAYILLESGIVYGDVTGEGKVNLTDVSSILKYIAGWNIEINTDYADVNCDTKVNLTDVSMILKYIADWDIILGM